MSPSLPRSPHHDVVIVGGGSAGVTVAARLRRSGITDIAIVEPSEQHYYQPLWTLVGGGMADVASTVRPQAKMTPNGGTNAYAVLGGASPCLWTAEPTASW